MVKRNLFLSLKGTYKGSLMKKVICIVATVVAISGCTAHGGGLDNRTKGALLGGVAGGFVGNQFGRGSGNAAATALGAVMGVLFGQSLSEDNTKK